MSSLLRSWRNLVHEQRADDLRHCVRVAARYSVATAPRSAVSGRPDLDQMQRRDPGRYGKLWRGTVMPTWGKARLAGERLTELCDSRPPEAQNKRE
jgi:hypothetical protein